MTDIPNLYLNELFFPKIPRFILQAIRAEFLKDPNSIPDLDQYGHAGKPIPIEAVAWLRTNILKGDWYMQYFNRDQGIHKDPKTSTRILYLIDLGGPEVITSFYKEDKKTVLARCHLQAERWYLLKTDRWHDVRGIEEGKLRRAISVRVHGYED